MRIWSCFRSDEEAAPSGEESTTQGLLPPGPDPDLDPHTGSPRPDAAVVSVPSPSRCSGGRSFEETDADRLLLWLMMMVSSSSVLRA